MRMLRYVLPAIALFALVFAACGDDDDSGAGNGNGDGETPAGSAAATPNPDAQQVAIAMTAQDYYVGGPNNVGIAILSTEDQRQLVAQNVRVTFFNLEDSASPQPVETVDAVASDPGVGEEVDHTHADGSTHTHGGEDETRTTYYAPFDGFTYAGLWGVLVEGELEDGTPISGNVGVQVRETATAPVPGEPAIPSENLTAADVDDISLIDSSTVPNDMHDVRIKDAIEAGRPLVITFSTPAYCATEFCGPVTDDVSELQEDYGEDVDFVHIEVWMDFEAGEPNPTFAEWGFTTEPWTYVIDSNGIVFDRWEGPASRTVIEPAVQAVAAGETYAAE